MTVSVGLIARTESFLQLEALVAASQVALGDRILVVCEAPPTLLSEKTLLENRWPGVHLVESHQQLLASEFILSRDYWLTVPAGINREIHGILPALDILDKNPDIAGVGGFERGPGGELSTSAFVSFPAKYGTGIALIPHEMSGGSWSASGLYATSRADALGGFRLFRRDDFSENLAFLAGGVEQAVASFGDPHSSNYLLSSALLTVVDERTVDTPAPHDPIALPPLVYEHWRAAGVSEVKVLDLGIALRNDDERAVIFYPREGFELVDETLGQAFFDRSSFYVIPENIAPLGPGFLLGQAFDGGRAGRGKESGSRVANLTVVESKLISRLRVVKAILPPRLKKFLAALAR